MRSIDPWGFVYLQWAHAYHHDHHYRMALRDRPGRSQRAHSCFRNFIVPVLRRPALWSFAVFQRIENSPGTLALQGNDGGKKRPRHLGINVYFVMR